MSQIFQIAPRPLVRSAKPVRDPKYRAYIRRLPCLVCLTTRNVEAAHTGPHGIGQKSCDLSCIPLCIGHHRRDSDSYHRLGPIPFQERHGMDIGAHVARLNEFYRTRILKEAA